MEEVEELVRYMRNLGITLRAQRGEVIARGPRGAITEDLAAEIRRKKPELLRWLDDWVEWTGSCSVCGAEVHGAGLREVFEAPSGPVRCLWCLGKRSPQGEC